MADIAAFFIENYNCSSDDSSSGSGAADTQTTEKLLQSILENQEDNDDVLHRTKSTIFGSESFASTRSLSGAFYSQQDYSSVPALMNHLRSTGSWSLMRSQMLFCKINSELSQQEEERTKEEFEETTAALDVGREESQHQNFVGISSE